MLSHANIFILLVLLQHSTIIRIILAETGSNQFDDHHNLSPTKSFINSSNTFFMQSSEQQQTTHNNSSTKHHNEIVQQLPIPEALGGNPPPIELGKLPEFPQRPDAVYFIVAVAGGAKIWGRTLARTLIDMGTPFGSPQGPPLRPLYVDIPQNGK